MEARVPGFNASHGLARRKSGRQPHLIALGKLARPGVGTANVSPASRAGPAPRVGHHAKLGEVLQSSTNRGQGELNHALDGWLAEALGRVPDGVFPPQTHHEILRDAHCRTADGTSSSAHERAAEAGNKFRRQASSESVSSLNLETCGAKIPPAVPQPPGTSNSPAHLATRRTEQMTMNASRESLSALVTLRVSPNVPAFNTASFAAIRAASAATSQEGIERASVEGSLFAHYAQTSRRPR